MGREFECSKVFNFFLRSGFFNISVSGSHKFTLQIKDVALKVEQELLFLAFDGDTLETLGSKVLRIVNINHIVFFISFDLGLAWSLLLPAVFNVDLFGRFKLVFIRVGVIVHLVEGVLRLDVVIAAQLRINDHLGLVEFIQSFMVIQINLPIKCITRNRLLVHFKQGIQLVDHLLVMGVFFSVNISQWLFKLDVNIHILLFKWVNLYYVNQLFVRVDRLIKNGARI